jgi:hypothetical protein
MSDSETSRDTHVDGNALGGLLRDMFGREMTQERSCCGACGSVGPLGSLLAFGEAPGEVLRCVACGTVVLVAVPTPTGLRVTFESLRWMELSTDPPS